MIVRRRARIASVLLAFLPGPLALAALGGCGDPTRAGQPGAPASVSILAGNEQRGQVGASLPIPLAVVVRDSVGRPVPGVPMAVVQYPFTGGIAEVAHDTTDAEGVVRFPWTLDTYAGLQSLGIAVRADRERLTASFQLYAEPGPVARIEVRDSLQSAYAGAKARVPIFRLVDAFGNALEGVRVAFTTGALGGAITGAAGTTSGSGTVSPTAWTLGADTGSYLLIATAGSVSASSRAWARSGAPASISVDAGDRVQVAASARVLVDTWVRVVDAIGRPVPDATVRWSAVSPAMQCTSVTDAAGRSRRPCDWIVGASFGEYLLDASVDTVRTHATAVVVAAPASIAFLSPSPFSSQPAGLPLADSVRIAVTATDGTPLAGIVVEIRAATLLASEPSPQGTTDARGVATVAWRVPGDVGPIRLTARAAGFPSPSSTVTIYATGQLALRELAAGGAFTCGIGASYPIQSVFCWGRNRSGELADESTADVRPVPTLSSIQRYYPPQISRISGGARHACIVLVTFLDVAVESTSCWGGNETGQVTGTASSRSGPVETGSYLGKVAAGATHSCGIAYSVSRLEPRTNWGSCWGDDSRGALGDGAGVSGGRTRVAFPADAASIRDVAAGDGFSCSMMADGHAYCWGRNDRGQLGDGSTTDRDLPVLVGGGVTFDTATSITTGSAHACARKLDGAVYCWGANDRGQLGDGTTVDRVVPTPVAGTTTFASLALGGAHTCGLTPDGSGWCWGANDAGQLGAGTFGGSVSTPQRVAHSAPLQKIAAGGQHTCALSIGTLAGSGRPYCWGLNADGQLGDGTTTNRSVPTAVADYHP